MHRCTANELINTRQTDTICELGLFATHWISNKRSTTTIYKWNGKRPQTRWHGLVRSEHPPAACSFYLFFSVLHLPPSFSILLLHSVVYSVFVRVFYKCYFSLFQNTMHLSVAENFSKRIFWLTLWPDPLSTSSVSLSLRNAHHTKVQIK